MSDKTKTTKDCTVHNFMLGNLRLTFSKGEDFVEFLPNERKREGNEKLYDLLEECCAEITKKIRREN